MMSKEADDMFNSALYYLNNEMDDQKAIAHALLALALEMKEFRQYVEGLYLDHLNEALAKAANTDD